MSKRRMFDFDAFMVEAEPEKDNRPMVRVFGEDVYLPATIPARIVLRAMRAAEAGEDASTQLRLEEVYSQACALYTKERVEGWMDKGLTMAQLDRLVGEGLRLYMQPEDDDTDGEGNPPAPEHGAKGKVASSNDGT